MFRAVPRKRAVRLLTGFALALVVAAAAIAATTIINVGRIGPSRHITGNGRLLQPPGRLAKLGHFPTGGAVTPDGRFYWTVSTGRALNDVRIVAVGRGGRRSSRPCRSRAPRAGSRSTRTPAGLRLGRPGLDQQRRDAARHFPAAPAM